MRSPSILDKGRRFQFLNARLAQLGEHLSYKQKVIGSSPIRSTNMAPQWNRYNTPPFQGGESGFNPQWCQGRYRLRPSRGSSCLKLTLIYFYMAPSSNWTRTPASQAGNVRSCLAGVREERLRPSRGSSCLKLT